MSKDMSNNNALHSLWTLKDPFQLAWEFYISSLSLKYAFWTGWGFRLLWDPRELYHISFLRCICGGRDEWARGRKIWLEVFGMQGCNFSYSASGTTSMIGVCGGVPSDLQKQSVQMKAPKGFNVGKNWSLLKGSFLTKAYVPSWFFPHASNRSNDREIWYNFWKIDFFPWVLMFTSTATEWIKLKGIEQTFTQHNVPGDGACCHIDLIPSSVHILNAAIWTIIWRLLLNAGLVTRGKWCQWQKPIVTTDL